MGAQQSQAATLEELAHFRKVPFTPEMEFEIPAPSYSRRVTDKKYFILLLAITAVWLPLVIYSSVYSNIQRLDGYDDCGNVCGVSNSYQNVECSGKDMSLKPYLALKQQDTLEIKKECVDTCTHNYTLIDHFCIPNGDPDLVKEVRDVLDFWKDIRKDISNAWWAIFVSVLISLGLTLFTVALYRYCVSFVVWFVLIASLVLFYLLTASLWYLYLTVPTEESKGGLTTGLFWAIIITIVSGFFTMMLVGLHKKIRLIIQLFKEASVAILAMPSISLLPIAGSILQVLFVTIFVSVVVALISAGTLMEVQPGVYDYIPNAAMVVTGGISFFLLVWYCQFVVDCQYMIVSGGISSWFFTSSKPQTRSSLVTSAKNVFNFHLGTAAIGALILVLTRMIKVILLLLTKNERMRYLINSCLSNIESVLKFFSRNAYILTALHGEPFFKSGKRAAKLMYGNLKEVVALNSLGHLVLIMSEVLIVMISGIIAIFICMATGVTYYMAPALICAYAAALIVSCFFSVYKSSVDTIFICFCEDTLLHDGMTKPYAMPRGLMQFIEDSKAVLNSK